MKEKPIPHPVNVFVCTQGGGGKKCHGGKKLFAQLRRQVKQRKLQGEIRVCASGCMDQCAKGPNVMVFPDNVWYRRVRERDIPAILDGLASRFKDGEDEGPT